jgi:hypothetical protein
MKTSFWYFVLFFFCNNLFALEPPEESYQLIKAERYTQSKNYYLFTLLPQLPEVNQLLSADKELVAITVRKKRLTILCMQQRCIKELGYLPYRNGKRLSETEDGFFPLITSLQIDTDEPMDP